MIIPLQRIPSQEFNIVLNNQNCTMKIYQRDKVYCDLTVDGNVIFNGLVALNNTDINLYRTTLFTGRLFFEDLNGNDDPNFSGFGTRWILNYV